MTTIIHVAHDADRATITEAIKALKFKHDRMPKAWLDRRDEVMAEIEALVDQWLTASQ